MKETQAIIYLIAEQTSDLLAEHWNEIEAYRDGEAEIKIAFSHTLFYRCMLREIAQQRRQLYHWQRILQTHNGSKRERL